MQCAAINVKIHILLLEIILNKRNSKSNKVVNEVNQRFIIESGLK